MVPSKGRGGASRGSPRSRSNPSQRSPRHGLSAPIYAMGLVGLDVPVVTAEVVRPHAWRLYPVVSGGELRGQDGAQGRAGVDQLGTRGLRSHCPSGSVATRGKRPGRNYWVGCRRLVGKVGRDGPAPCRQSAADCQGPRQAPAQRHPRLHFWFERAQPSAGTWLSSRGAPLMTLPSTQVKMGFSEDGRAAPAHGTAGDTRRPAATRRQRYADRDMPRPTRPSPQPHPGGPPTESFPGPVPVREGGADPGSD